MICADTISAGFYFMFGKFLFDASVALVVITLCAIVYGVVCWRTK
jgi:hypothetical protein